MIRVLRISGALALALAAVLLVISGIVSYDGRPGTREMQSVPVAVERLKKANLEPVGPSPAACPLIVQAETFAAYLNPPASGGDSPSPAVSHVPETPPSPPAPPLGRLRLYATSCPRDLAGGSMALVCDGGSPREDQRWVREGSQVGPCVVCEVRRGVIVYREGDHLYEAMIDHGAGPPSAVASMHPVSRRTRAAMLNAIGGASVPADPNGVD